MLFRKNRQSPSYLVPVEEAWEERLLDRYNAERVSKVNASE